MAVVSFVFWGVPRTVGLGDAPESLVGVDSAGVLHAPGYVLYALTAAAFTSVAAVGDLAWRLNVFSALCTFGAAAGIWWIARRFGASPAGATVGALGWALATSVWFYAGFAKHNSFTALGIAAVWSLTLLGPAQAQGERRAVLTRSLLAGLLSGLLLGALWPAVVVATPTTILLLVWRPHPHRLLAVVSFVGAAAAGVASVVALIWWRAAADPASNWGRVDSPGRLVDLLTLADFGWGRDSAAPGPADGTTGWLFGDLFANLARYLTVIAVDLGPIVALLAIVGIVVAWRRLPRLVAAALSAAVALNLAVLALSLGITLRGVESALAQNGFLAPALLSVGVLAALGATRVEQATVARSARWGPWAGAGLAVAVVVFAMAFHRQPAAHTDTAFADTYATQVFEDLPEDAVLIVWGAERAFPLWAHQTVDGARPDVTVVAGDGLGRTWYREQLRARDGLPLEAQAAGDEADEIDALIDALNRQQPRRAVFLDMTATETLDHLHAAPVGLVAAVDPDQDVTAAALSERIDELMASPGVLDDPARSRWPNTSIVTSYASAAVAAAQLALTEDEPALARRNIDLAHRSQPDNAVIDALRQAIHQQSAGT